MEEHDLEPRATSRSDVDYDDPRWWTDIIQSLIRWLLNIFAGGMIAKGYGNHELWEKITAGSVIMGTLFWAYFHQRIQKKKRKKNRHRHHHHRKNQHEQKQSPPDPFGPGI